MTIDLVNKNKKSHKYETKIKSASYKTDSIPSIRQFLSNLLHTHSYPNIVVCKYAHQILIDKACIIKTNLVGKLVCECEWIIVTSPPDVAGTPNKYTNYIW